MAHVLDRPFGPIAVTFSPVVLLATAHPAREDDPHPRVVVTELGSTEHGRDPAMQCGQRKPSRYKVNADIRASGVMYSMDVAQVA